MSSPYFKLFHRFGILPRNEELYTLAFTHPSCNASAGTKHVDYERLEFLGDAIVGAVVADLCYRLHPEMDEGGLTQIKNQLVQSQSEASLCLFLGLDEYIRVGNNFASSNPMGGGAMSKAEKALYENVFESFIGAMYLDQGMTFTYRFLHDLFFQRVQDAKIELDPKSELQHHLQADGAVSIVYKVLQKDGTAQNTHVVAAVFFDGMELGRGEGSNTKLAEVEAAKDALHKLSIPKN